MPGQHRICVLVIGRSEGEAAALARRVIAAGHEPTIDPRHARGVICGDPAVEAWFRRHTGLTVLSPTSGRNGEIRPVRA
jgi:hypothetical protein